MRPSNDDDNAPRPVSVTQNHTVSSTLTFPSVSGMDSGKIKCEARIPSGESTGGMQFNTAEEPTHLSVLGELV